MIDRIAAYWDRRPCNLRHSDAPVGSLDYSLQVTARKRFVEPHLWAFADFPAWQGSRVLDLGCGIGTESLEFARHGADVTGLDLSGTSLDIARQRGAAELLPVRFVHGNMEDRRFDADYFDLVWAWGSLHHTPDPVAVLTNACRCLKPDGLLRVMLYHRLSTKALRLWLKAGCPGDFDAAVALGSEAQERCPLTRSYTRRAARDLLATTGFQVQRVSVRHIFSWRVPDYVRYRYVRGWPWRLLPTWPLEWLLGWHLLLEARK